MMEMSFQVRENAASQLQILNHLLECDPRFKPPLSERVTIAAYATKIYQNANRFEMWCDAELVGLVAAYFNNAEKKAFITNVSVTGQLLGRGIASTLISRTVDRAMACGLDRISLQVDTSNLYARNLYEKHGFHTFAQEGGSALMELDLRKGYSP